MAREYVVYRLTSPNERAYVGFTGQQLRVRWAQHQRASLKGYKHPLTQALAKYGAENFKVEVLSTHVSMQDALDAERVAIAAEVRPYNISAGGERDFAAATARFKELLQDPAWREDYVAKLSAGLRSSEAYQACVPSIVAALENWREDAKVSFEGQIKTLEKEARDKTKQSRAVLNLQEKVELQREAGRLKREADNLKQAYFERLKEIDAQREKMLDEIADQLNLTPDLQPLFMIQWKLHG